jgi:Ca2+-binding EF-hand superfamily protein
MDLEFTVTETITRQNGRVNEINYEFEEITVENVSMGITSKQERRSRIYNANITREQYNNIAQKVPNALSFDDFINVLRPFIMGHYDRSELEQAFDILDKDRSGYIHIDELGVFLPIINEYATSDALRNYIRKVDMNADGNLSYEEFQSLILKGIGRDIICNHI